MHVRGRRGRLFAAVPIALGLTACAADAPSGTSTSGNPTSSAPPVTRSYTVTLVAHAGPTCPVERPDEPCPDVPVEGTVRVEQSGMVVVSGRTDSTGTYTPSLPPGAYRASVDTGSELPRCEPVDFAVIDRDITVDVSCDTGIR